MKILDEATIELKKDEKLAVVVSDQNAPIINKAMHTNGQSLLLTNDYEIMKISTNLDNFVIIKFDDTNDKVIMFYNRDDRLGSEYGLLNDGYSQQGTSNLHKFTVLKDTELHLDTLFNQEFAFNRTQDVNFGTDMTYAKYNDYVHEIAMIAKKYKEMHK